MLLDCLPNLIVTQLPVSHLAAAVLAMNHFNARDARIIPELAELGDCNIKFAINETNFLDTETYGAAGSNRLFQVHREQKRNMCGIVGPFNDLTARGVAAMAAAAQIPHIPHRGYSIALALEWLAPMTTNLSPDQIMIAKALVSHLRRTGRDNFIAFVHPITDVSVQFALVQGMVFGMYGIDQYAAYGYMSPFFENKEADREIPSQLQKVKDRGFRTIVIAMEAFIVELPALADAAEALDMLNGDYVFVFLPMFPKAAIHNAIQLSDLLVAQQGLPSFENVTKLLRGAALLSEVEGFQYLGSEDPFLHVWKEQGRETVKQINGLYRSRTLQS